MTDVRRAENHSRGSVLVGLSALLLVLGGGLLGGYAITAKGSTESVEAALSKADPAIVAGVRSAAEAALDRETTVVFDERERRVTWRELGIVLDDRAVASEAERLDEAPAPDYYTKTDGKHTAPLRAERKIATEKLLGLKSELDIAPENARMDLEARKVHPAKPGFGIDLYGSVSAIEAAARQRATLVKLEGVAIEPDITIEDIGVDDISTVLARFSTRFAVREKSRNANLKLAASKLDGHVIRPGELFSFNETVGARSEKEGYKIAHVITAGQMVDGLAGGACQISTTLHGAAFFSGIDIVSSTPHSRPSTYVQMGLDATVVWPNVDLKLRNSYDFPVVIHYRVARGEAVVEILGKERPFDKIAFERDVAEKLDFDTITREDGELPVGSMVVEQDGFPGYKLKRFRKFYKNGKVVKSNKWELRYRPVTEYVRLGINPDPNLPQPKQKKGHGPRPPRRAFYRLTQ